MFPARSFDFVVDIESSFYYPDKLAFIRGVHHVLKDDGLFVLAFYIENTRLQEIYDCVNRYFKVEKSEDITENALKALKLDKNSVSHFCDTHFPPSKSTPLTIFP